MKDIDNPYLLVDTNEEENRWENEGGSYEAIL